MEYDMGMSRAATTSDVFNAIAEPRRREIVGVLAGGRPRSVSELVAATRMPQPTVSKHLAVLRTVGVVSVQRVGKSRFYALNPAELKPVHDWIAKFEKLWAHQLDRIKIRAEQKAKERAAKN
jgi:DNA-binding transcriptional ArsR family regulator